MADVNGVLVFGASDGPSGLELWKSEGERWDTFLVQEIVPGPGSSSPDSFTLTSRQNLFFVADDNLTGRELWVIPKFAPSRPVPPKKHPAVRFKGSEHRYSHPFDVPSGRTFKSRSVTEAMVHGMYH
jgi:ELWxxDGT repeat protein